MVSESFGLDALGLDIRELDFTGGRVGVGRYLTPQTYLSITQNLGGGGGQAVSIEYYFKPEWKFTTSSDSIGTNSADVFWQYQY